ncbi:hypothetical protein [Capnocytophaga sp.]|uniref:hypothetical protein n=1 Tax=Capnocytophaga sp. TaxID=44737 RepID=UPI0026DBA451|nr:hypothetical protein [Capnocytophaga sp.]MDO5105638.1 hypothetical protein [Capnocytophaga sp.]
MRKIILLASVLILSSCQFFNKNNNENQEVTDTDIPRAKLVWLDFIDPALIEKKFVTNRKGTTLFLGADENTRKIDTAPYGTGLEVIEEYEDWYVVQWYVTEEYEEDGKEISRMGWAKAYVKKTDVGNLEDIKLKESDLYALYEELESPISEETVRDMFQIELIDQKTYNEAKKLRVSHLLQDTLAVRKLNGALSLTFEDYSVVVLKDNDTDNDEGEVYEYMGQIEALQKYVVYASYFESGEYILFDKRNGKRQEFSGFPYLSPDKKQIFVFPIIMEEQVSGVIFYEVNENQEIKELISAPFKNWMPYFDVYEGLFWATDEYFYMPVNHTAVYWNEYGNYNTQNCQYLRIKKK